MTRHCHPGVVSVVGTLELREATGSRFMVSRGGQPELRSQGHSKQSKHKLL